RALEISQEAEYIAGIATATLNLGDVAIRKGNVKEAIEFYEETIKLAEGAGMRQTLTLAYFVAGDAHYLLNELDVSISNYKLSEEIAVEIGHKLYAFNAIVSTVISLWAQEEKPDSEILGLIRSNIGETSNWLKSSDSSLMKEVRRKVLEDPESDNELCIFYDGEKTFECRVERKAPRKECFGNLFWMGNLCPHFCDFLSKLDE
ncbi:MAG: tetratricopeptide repeat protein, partial [Candidatus Thorarchaeota archaeon]|nr:tetratricopeptide repeat protein [Candidatus Thorarchaeota archaeon]